MLIKEYRIPLPLTVEEYRIAQLYMIAVSQYLAKYLENILNDKTHKSVRIDSYDEKHSFLDDV